MVLPKIKIAFVITRLCSGGASQAIKNLAYGLNREVYHLTLMYGQLSDEEVDVSEDLFPFFDASIELKFTFREFSLFRDHLATREIQKHIRQHQFDIVHTHTSKAGFIGRLAAYREKVKKIIHSTHGIIFNEDADISSVRGLKKKIFLIAEKKAAHWCDKILTLSEKEIADWQSLKVGSKTQYLCLPSPVDTTPFVESRKKRSELRGNRKIFSGQKIIVLLGRLSSEKGHAIAIDAMKKIDHAELWIVGEGPMRSDIEKLISDSHMGAQVKMMGNRNDISQWLSLADCLVLPSSYEGQGLVLIEAMAAGVPIVATNVGGVSEIVKNEVNGLLVPAKNSEALAEAVIRVLTEPALKDVFVSESDKIYPEYKIEHICRQLERVYECC